MIALEETGEVGMSEVLVRNLDEAVVEQLKGRARGNGRSLQAELKLILEQAARPGSSRPSRAEYRALADRVRASLEDRPQSDSAALLAEDRSR
jgi:plasmid stability protein